MLVNIFRNETKKFIKNPYGWILFAAFVFIFLVYVFARAYMIRLEIQSGELIVLGVAQDLQAGLDFFSYGDVFIYAGMAAIVFGSDYETRYLPAYLNRGVRRMVLVFGKFLFTLVLAAVIEIFIFLFIFGLSVITEKIFFGEVILGNLNLSAVFPVLVSGFWSSLPYLFLTAFFAVAARSMVFAAGAGLVYGTLGEYLIYQASGKYPNLFRYFPSMLSESLRLFNVQLDVHAIHPVNSGMYVSAAEAFIFLTVISLVLGLIYILIFSRQDLGG